MADVIRNLNTDGLDSIDQEFDNFLEAVTQRAYLADTTWQ